MVVFAIMGKKEISFRALFLTSRLKNCTKQKVYSEISDS